MKWNKLDDACQRTTGPKSVLCLQIFTVAEPGYIFTSKSPGYLDAKTPNP